MGAKVFNVKAYKGDHDTLEVVRMDKKDKSRALARKEIMDLITNSKNLTDADLRKINLAKVDFSGCDLSFANLSYSNLKEANFEKANLTGASLWSANLENANFTNANLEDADLDYAKVRGAVFKKANLKRTTLPIELVSRDEIVRSVNEGSKVVNHSTLKSGLAKNTN